MVEFYSEIFIRVAVVLFALWIGGLSTTVYGRLPDGVSIGPSHKPMCDNCGKEIKFKYFFPILGYILSRGKCIHCNVKIPKVYLMLEIAVFLYIILISFTYRVIDERFIFKSLFGAYCIVLCFIYYHNRKITYNIIWLFLVFLLAYRGYSNSLPSVITLFLCTVFSYLALKIFSKNIKIQQAELILSVISIISLGEIISFASFLCAFVVYKLNHYKKYNFFNKIINKQRMLLSVPIMVELMYIVFN